MTRLHILSAAALAALVLPAAAAAQDFTGLRGEVRAGYDRVSIDDDYEDIADSLEGVAYGAAVGYDRAFAGKYTVGVEAGVQWVSGSQERVTLGADTLAFETGRDLDLMVRVGRVIDARTLVFGKIGYAHSRLDVAYSSAAAPGEIERAHESFDGLRMGVGGERRLTDKLSATAEYRHTRYEDDISRNQLLVGLAYRF